MSEKNMHGLALIIVGLACAYSTSASEAPPATPLRKALDVFNGNSDGYLLLLVRWRSTFLQIVT